MGLLDYVFDFMDHVGMSKEDRNYNEGVQLINKGEYDKAFEKLVVAAERETKGGTPFIYSHSVEFKSKGLQI